jgi:transposase
MGRAIAITRTDISARELRFIAKRTRDCRVVRRILAIALVVEGVDRATSARSSGMDRQTLRDWVHRYNCGGIAELSDRRGKGAKPRLSPTQQARFVAWVEAKAINRSVLASARACEQPSINHQSLKSLS